MHYELCIVHCPYVLLSNIELANKRLSGWVVGVYNFHAFFLVGFSSDEDKNHFFAKTFVIYAKKLLHLQVIPKFTIFS